MKANTDELREQLIEILRGDQVVHNNTGYNDESVNKWLNEKMFGAKADEIMKLFELPNEPKKGNDD